MANGKQTNRGVAVYKLDKKTGKVLDHYSSIKEAAESVGVDSAAIHHVLTGHTKSSAGFHWRVADAPLDDDDLERMRESVEMQEREDGTIQYRVKLVGEDFSNIDEMKARVREIAKLASEDYVMRNFTYKQWETSMKQEVSISESGNVVSPGTKWHGERVTKYQEPIKVLNTGISAQFVPTGTSKKELVEKLASEIKPLPAYSPAVLSSDNSLSMEICIFDLHLGKTAFHPDTFEITWGPADVRRHYNNCIDWMLDNADMRNIEQFVLPVGNDMLHVDNMDGKTRNGTTVGERDMWGKLFNYGTDMIIAAAEKLGRYAPVYLKFIRGNHDEHTVFSMGRAALERFRNVEHVHVENTDRPRTYHHYGVSMIGFSHSHEGKINAYKDAMVVDEPKMFSQCSKFYIHVGHWHKSAKKKYIVLDSVDEEFGMELEIIPSLCPTDAWHNNQLYIGNMRRAKAFIYDKGEGQVQQLIYNLNEK